MTALAVAANALLNPSQSQSQREERNFSFEHQLKDLAYSYGLRYISASSVSIWPPHLEKTTERVRTFSGPSMNYLAALVFAPPKKHFYSRNKINPLEPGYHFLELPYPGSTQLTADSVPYPRVSIKSLNDFETRLNSIDFLFEAIGGPSRELGDFLTQMGNSGYTLNDDFNARWVLEKDGCPDLEITHSLYNLKPSYGVKIPQESTKDINGTTYVIMPIGDFLRRQTQLPDLSKIVSRGLQSKPTPA